MTPEANVFLVVNLGCEMIYVIDQRLQAQKISDDKSTEVVRDIANVLLDPKFVDRLINGSKEQKSLITADHCKIMLGDIACCSIMRINGFSMDKLWNLMTMLFKWQMYVTDDPQHLLDITFRHIDGVSKMHTEAKNSTLVDYTKNTLLDFWNSNGEKLQLGIYKTIKSWLECFNVKISILLRLGFQAIDSKFHEAPDMGYFKEYACKGGENIYVKSKEITAQREQQKFIQPNTIHNLEALINIDNSSCSDTRKNIFFYDMHNIQVDIPTSNATSEFQRMKTQYNPSSNCSWKDFVAPKVAQVKSSSSSGRYNKYTYSYIFEQ